ncbi:MAG: polysaccharide biosynthesis protein [Lachnospiraceae bacterium]|nr:polysaccharide biosynthesis protein [Lachnospiraceae bacterium]
MRLLMQLPKHLKNPLVTGTLLLTITGMLSKVIGFFYRIFLSRTIGAEGMGIYQLIFPIFSLGLVITAAGIQTAISKYVSSCCCREASGYGMGYLYAGLFLSVCLSLLVGLPMYHYAGWISDVILDEPRCLTLLQIVAYALPFASIHACINGYYYGQKKTAIPAVTQFAEQCSRVLAVYILLKIYEQKGIAPTPSIAVWGIVCGEFCSMLISITCLHFYKAWGGFFHKLKEIALFSAPLTANRITYHVFASAESILIPLKLKAFGYSSSEALSVFGILNGMAMPMILFPSTLTNSVSVLLLPTISEASAQENVRMVRSATRKTIFYCLLLGFASTAFFLVTGRYIGQYMFHNTLAGSFIRTLSWICPFLYLTTTLSSILHGLGKAGTAFFINLSGCAIRIVCIYLLIPTYGIRIYLYAMLASQLVAAVCSIYFVRRSISRSCRL